MEGARAVLQDINEFLQAACIQHDCCFHWEQKGLGLSQDSRFSGLTSCTFPSKETKNFSRSVRCDILLALRI